MVLHFFGAAFNLTYKNLATKFIRNVDWDVDVEWIVFFLQLVVSMERGKKNIIMMTVFMRRD